MSTDAGVKAAQAKNDHKDLPRAEVTTDALSDTIALEEKFGYTQELPRTKSFFNLWMMTIVLSSVPYGQATTLYYPLSNGGPVVAVWDWIVMSIVYVCVAISLGEIASRYPVSGGLYYWSFQLSPPRFAPLVSYIVGWISVVGNVTVTLAVNFATTQLILSSVVMYYPDYYPTAWQTVLASWALILLVGVIGILAQHWAKHIDMFTIVLVVAVVVATVITLPVKAASGRFSGKQVFTEFMGEGSGFPRGWGFVMGLIQGAYCYSATGMLPSMAEEAKQPDLSIPRAMVFGVIVNGILGFMFLLALMFTLGDISTILASPTGQPLPQVFLQATGERGAAFGLFFLILIIGLSCGLACSTATSRCIWAFSRDGGLPGARFLGRISSKVELPLNAFFVNTALQCALACIYFGSTAAFNAFLGVSVICLGGACFLPILVSFIRGRKEIKSGRFYKGTFGYVCNVVSICWFLLAIPLLSFPTFLPVTAQGMNYASVVFVGFAAIALAWYIISGRKNFRGPPDSRTGL